MEDCLKEKIYNIRKRTDLYGFKANTKVKLCTKLVELEKNGRQPSSTTKEEEKKSSKCEDRKINIIRQEAEEISTYFPEQPRIRGRSRKEICNKIEQLKKKIPKGFVDPLLFQEEPPGPTPFKAGKTRIITEEEEEEELIPSPPPTKRKRGRKPKNTPLLVEHAKQEKEEEEIVPTITPSKKRGRKSSKNSPLLLQAPEEQEDEYKNQLTETDPETINLAKNIETTIREADQEFKRLDISPFDPIPFPFPLLMDLPDQKEKENKEDEDRSKALVPLKTITNVLKQVQHVLEDILVDHNVVVDQWDFEDKYKNITIFPGRDSRSGTDYAVTKREREEGKGKEQQIILKELDFTNANQITNPDLLKRLLSGYLNEIIAQLDLNCREKYYFGKNNKQKEPQRTKCENLSLIPFYFMYTNVDRNKVYFEMPYIKGITGKGLYKMKFYSASIDRILADNFFRILQTLDYIHSNNIIHGDIQPNNIRVDSTSKEKLCYLINFHNSCSTENPFCSSIWPTPGYVDPRFLLKEIKELDEQSDLYSLGITFIEFFLRRPFYMKNGLPLTEEELSELTLEVMMYNLTNNMIELINKMNYYKNELKDEETAFLLSPLLTIFPKICNPVGERPSITNTLDELEYAWSF